MKLLAIVVLLALTAQPEGLVEAAKDAKKKRGKSTTKVITNKDVRQSKGKLIVSSAPPLPEPEKAEPMTVARHDEQKRNIDAAQVRMKNAEKAVSDLRAELLTLEQQYYNENDLDRRDGELVRRFEAAKARFAAAAAELEAAQKDPMLSIASPVRIIGADVPPDSEADAGAAEAGSPTRPPQRTNNPI